MKTIYIIIFLILLIQVNVVSAKDKQKRVNLYGYVLENSGTPIAEAMIIIDRTKLNKTSNVTMLIQQNRPEVASKSVFNALLPL